MSASQICVSAAGLFLMTGLLTGLWKYLCITRSATAEAPYYVNIAHRAALMYAFAALVMAELARGSAWPESINRFAAMVPLLFFALAIATYMVHGWLRDTDNQLRVPYRLGNRELPGASVHGYMVALAVGEIGGVGVLLVGYLAHL